MGMTRVSSKWILSHSTWYKFPRSGQWVKARQEQLAVNVRKSWTVLAAGNQTGKRKSPKRVKSA